ncbi:deoxyribose-phosphate aldolase-like isoform X2 [Drosophila sulfurigaster albostrigata]|uniref:deoxyribose-phosphate aldolase-like isoform X2 n=1 Tax=Drosophila sulfurigaster albostrigata TaxID=89887 RepID=UPI002D21AA23|nr:deoxyribose-phosphate aldolase-like isoform X2 [Drosophila sulfurigaster albostrigata]
MDSKTLVVNKTLPFDPALLMVNISLRQVEEIAISISKRCMVSGVNEIAWALRALMLTDLTTLAGDDTHAYTTLEQLNQLDNVPISAVTTGFPTGQYGLQTRLQEISHAILAGATEIDVVISRQLALLGDWKALYNEVVLMRSACGEHALLKTILAIGELGTMENVYKAAMVCMMAGADFLKTSTGMEIVNATLSVGLVMIFAIQEFKRRTCQIVGIKPAGGIRTVRDAIAWMTLVNETLGSRWLTRDRFRFGTTGLLNDIEKVVRDGVAKLEREAAEKASQSKPIASEACSEDAMCKELRKKQQEKK